MQVSEETQRRLANEFKALVRLMLDADFPASVLCEQVTLLGAARAFSTKT